MKIEERAVKAKAWRWLPGMLVDGFVARRVGCGAQPDKRFCPMPDLTDPATMGCLLALVRDAHRDAYMAAGCDGEDWIVADCDGLEVSRGQSEREALVKALEAAPEYKELDL